MLNIVCSGFFIALSAVLFAASMAIPGATEWDVVGSRLVPQIYIGGMALCALCVFVGSLAQFVKNPQRSAGNTFLRDFLEAYGSIVIVFAVLLAWFIGIEVVGFYISAFAFLLFLQWYLNGCKMTVTIALVAAVSPVVVYFLFERGLKVMMPAGALFG